MSTPAGQREARPVAAVLGVVLWALVGSLLGACETQPAVIRIKLPPGVIQPKSGEVQLPPFTSQGEKVQIQANAYDAGGVLIGPAKVKWQSDDPKVVTVNDSGMVIAAGSGVTKVRAVGVGYAQPIEGALEFKVVIVGTVKVVPPDDKCGKLHLGEQKQFKAEVLDDRGNPIPDAKIRWRANTYALSVSTEGMVEGMAIGDAKVIAEAGDTSGAFPIQVLDWK